MKILLDTHAFLWGLTDETRLSDRVRRLLPSADSWLSVASLWEILIKCQSGKLRLPQPVGPYVMLKLKFNGVKLLPVTAEHVLRIESLPMHHRDPFDRMLVAQSLTEELPLVTSDAIFQRYGMNLIW